MDNTTHSKSIINNSKKLFYLSICFVSLISGVIFLITIKGNNRKFNQNLLTNANTLYINYLKDLNKGVFENLNLDRTNPSNSPEKKESIKHDEDLNYPNILNILKEFSEQKYLFPFKLKIISETFDEKNNMRFIPLSERIQVDQLESLTYITINIHSIQEKELKYFLSLITKFAIYEKREETEKEQNIATNNNNTISYLPIISEINIYKHINIYFLINQNEKIGNKFSNIFSNLESISLGHKFNFFIKYLYYKSPYEELNLRDETLYEQLKSINSKQIFEELNDESSINLILHDKINGEERIEIFYNKDINNDIYSFNFKELPKNLDNSKNFLLIIKQLIQIKLLNVELKKIIEEEEFTKQNLIKTIIQIDNSHSLNFARLFVKSLDNLDKLNKIFALYESIRTIDKIKEKVFNYIKFKPS